MPLGSALNSLLLLAKNLNAEKTTVYTGKKGKKDKPVVFDRNEKINFLERANPEDYGFKTHFEALEYLKKLGFKTNPENILVKDVNEILSFIERDGGK